MRLRFWLYLLFGAFSVLPIIVMGSWVHHHIIANELDRSGRSSQLLAETHARTINNYLAEIKRAFENKLARLRLDQSTDEVSLLAPPGRLDRLLVIDAASGAILRQVGETGFRQTRSDDTERIDAATLAALRETARRDESSFTPVLPGERGENRIYIVRNVDNRLIAASFGTDFLVGLAAATRFDKGGHAAIFDQRGQLLAHPRQDWQGERKSIAGLPPVALALSGRSGVSVFRSPATRSEMIAGVANIPLVNWGVMVPQPVNDVVERSGLARKSIYTVMLLTLALILLISILASHMLSTPLENLANALTQTGSERGFRKIERAKGLFIPREQVKVLHAFNKMVDRLKNSHRQMTTLAFSDTVTLLPNREAISKIIGDSLVKLANRNMTAVVAFINIDDFKVINDTQGHHTGDQALRCIAARMAGIVEADTGISPTDNPLIERKNGHHGTPDPVLGRFGGAEFILFLPENHGLERLNALLQKLLTAIATPIAGIETTCQLNGSIGLAHFPQHGLTFNELAKRADIAMYHAKKHGQGKVQLFGDGIGDMTAAELRRDVHKAIENDELELYYQPKVTAADGEVKSVEALVRWVHPSRGVINPNEFIPAIENTDTTMALGEWVVRRACRDIKLLDTRGCRLDVAVNIAAKHFVSDDFTARVLKILRSEDCHPSRFEIEVTEETALSTHDGAANIISNLHAEGFRVSLDDYGRGYSNLTRLSELRVDTIKIDGPLTARLTRDERTRVIFEATINMAEGLNCKTVAEGVETADEVRILTSLGCTELQGYYFSPPLPFPALIEWIEERCRNPVAELHSRLKAS